MTKEQTKAIVSRYRDILADTYHTTPVRRQETTNLHERIQHLMWMCDEVEYFLKEEKVEKAMRWLGFIQGAFWILGIQDIAQSKKDNMPEGETFDLKRI